MSAWIRSVGPLAVADLRHRYAGSFLGGLWALAGPLLEVAAYALVFAFLLPSSARDVGPSYAIFIASGLLPWAALREAVEMSGATLVDNRWIRRSRVPMELLVARHVVVASSRIVVGLLLVWAAAVATRGLGAAMAGVWPTLMAVAIQLVAVYGLGLALAPLGALYPDLRPGLTSALTLLTFASPILYPESALGIRTRAFVQGNPFTHLLRLYRAPLALPGGDWGAADVVVPALAAGVVLAVGWWLQRQFWWAARDTL